MGGQVEQGKRMAEGDSVWGVWETTQGRKGGQKESF